MKALLALVLIAACGSPDPAPQSAPDTAPPTADTPVAAPDPAATMPLTLRAKFEPVSDGTLHAASPTDLDGDGVFVGNDLGPEDYEYLDPQLLAMVGYEGLYACMELEDGLFVLRGPGQEQPTDLFLAQWEQGPRILTWVADLAFAYCGDEECSRQESWLVDLDGDGRRDLVRRGRIENLASGEIDETFDAWLIGPGGTLNTTSLPSSERSRYRMGGAD